jgi:molybdopterin-synthase adenylyltransferase
MMNPPSEFFPLLPAYLKVTAARLSQDDPPRFDLRLAAYPATSRERRITVSAETLFLLSLADGSRTLDEALQRARLEFDDSDHDYATEFRELVEHGILVDAADHPELRPGTHDRFARHLLFYASVGAHAPMVQRRLKSARVALVGVGGIGTWLSFLLGAAGVGTIKLIDGDRIEESNLTRQLYFTLRDVGMPKVEVARQRLLDVNPQLDCQACPRSIACEADMDDLVQDVDLILLSGDQPADINDIVDRYSFRRSVPWSSAGYAHTIAVCGPLLVPGRTACRACAVGNAEYAPMGTLPLIDEINARFQVPSFGPVNGLAASMQAKEAIAWLGGMQEFVQTLDSVFTMDVMAAQSTITPISHRAGCDRCGSRIAGVTTP